MISRPQHFEISPVFSTQKPVTKVSKVWVESAMAVEAKNEAPTITKIILLIKFEYFIIGYRSKVVGINFP